MFSSSSGPVVRWTAVVLTLIAEGIENRADLWARQKHGELISTGARTMFPV
jgi:hypothetical protein